MWVASQLGDVPDQDTSESSQPPAAAAAAAAGFDGDV